MQTQAIVVTTSNDTIACTIAVPIFVYGESISIKRNEKNDNETFPVENVTYLATASSVYESLYMYNYDLGKYVHRLAWLLSEGEINLYFYIVHFHTPEAFVQVILKKEGKIYQLDEDHFKQTIRPLVSQYPDMLKKLDAKHFQYGDISEFIKAYNKLADH